MTSPFISYTLGIGNITFPPKDNVQLTYTKNQQRGAKHFNVWQETKRTWNGKIWIQEESLDIPADKVQSLDKLLSDYYKKM